MVRAFLDEAGEKREISFLEAKQYNFTYNEDKRFLRIFKQAKDLGPALWQSLVDDKAEADRNCNTNYEGIAVYALCEDDADLKVAGSAVASIPEPYIVVSIPHEPQPFGDVLLKVKACRHYLQAGEAEKLNPQTEIRFRDLFENADVWRHLNRGKHSRSGLLSGKPKGLPGVLGKHPCCWRLPTLLPHLGSDCGFIRTRRKSSRKPWKATINWKRCCPIRRLYLFLK